MKTYIIDGSRFANLEEFFEEVTRVLIPGVFWGRNLDAFNDILRGGFGTPDAGFIILWEKSEMSRQRLGYEETAKQLEKRLAICHPENRAIVQEELQQARQHSGNTVFDWLVEIIRDHGEGGTKAGDNVVLRLI